MSYTVEKFRHAASIALHDDQLQSALEGATGLFANNRVQALAEIPAADELRDHFKAIRHNTLGNLAEYLEQFERNAKAAGAHIHWARDGEEACKIVNEIAKRHNVTMATKSKSMATEEIHLNQALAKEGVEAVETDLGEWIIQLAGEPPSHIIAPAIHKSRQQVADLFSKEVGRELSTDIPTLTQEARRLLRKKFLAAGMGISGGNILVAETGSIVIVTNEGNARLTTSAPPVHVAVVGIEKMAPSWQEAAVWLSLLARSATGQPLSIYTSVITGPRRPDEPDGPDELHIVLLDNGRSKLVGGKYEEALQCIRCGACLNACPVYKEAGGHAYGSPYSGPIGAIITPLLLGLEEYEALPHASSLCGACLDVCPARINIPRMLLELRADSVKLKLLPWWERASEKTAATVMSRAGSFRFATTMMRFLQKPLAADGFVNVPGGLNPAQERKLPSLARRSFRELWEQGDLEDLL